MSKALTAFGMIVVIGLAGVSITANFWFGLLLTEGDERWVYATLFALLDGLKTILVPLAALAAVAGLRHKSCAAVLVFVLLSALSFTAEVGLYATTKSETVGDAKAAHETYAVAKDTKDKADAALAAFGTVRPLGGIEGNIAALKRDRLYDRSAQCTDATALDSRDLCARIDRLKGEHQTALEHAAAKEAAQAAAVNLGKQDVAAAMRVIDPQAEALAKLLSPVWAVDADTVRTVLAVFIAVLIELGSGLGPWLVMPAPHAARQRPFAPAPKSAQGPQKPAPSEPPAALKPAAAPERPKPRAPAAAADDHAVARWAASAMVKRRGAYVRAAEAREAFEAWCAAEKIEPPNPTAFGKAMGAAGYTGRKIGGVRRYEGVALVSAKPSLRVVASSPEPEPPPAEPASRIVGKVSQFASARLRQSVGERTSLEEAYGAYKGWCGDLGLSPVDLHRFKASLGSVCGANGLSVAEIGDRAFCIDVKLAG